MAGSGNFETFMEKRVLIAVVLSFLVLYGYQALFVKPVPPAKARTTTTMPAAKDAAAVSQAPAGAPAPTPGAPPSAPAAPVAQALVAADAERDVIVETKTIRAVFTNRGARLKSWRLKNYLDLDKHPQELVPAEMPPNTALPFELKVDDEAATARLRDALFEPSVQGPVDGTRQEQRVAFEFKDASGLYARKEFVFEVVFDEELSATGSGATKKEAQRQAAKAALAKKLGRAPRA